MLRGCKVDIVAKALGSKEKLEKMLLKYVPEVYSMARIAKDINDRSGESVSTPHVQHWLRQLKEE